MIVPRRIPHYGSREAYSECLGFDIKDKSIYDLAFTHKSAIKEFQIDSSNERLEFLGDAVLNVVITKYLYEKYPDSNEGFLTRIRTKLVSGVQLAKFSEHLGLEKFLLMNHRALRANWQTNTRMREDVFESVVGAIYLDQGLPRCRKFVINLIDEKIDWSLIYEDRNWKDQLMRTCQFKSWLLPEYKLCGSDPFIVEIIVNGNICGRGKDTNKKVAEQKGAEEALKFLKVEIPATNAAFL